MSPPVAIILGAGGNTGVAIAKRFKSEGWQVATVSRSPAKEELATSAALHVQADFTNHTSVEKAWHEVEQKLGIPNVVIYNAYSVTFIDKYDEAFSSIAVDKFAEDLSVNVTSVYAALKLAVDGFKRLPANAPKTFIYTGNMQSGLIVPETMTLGVGKNASLYLIETAVQLYGNLARFYVGDERDSEGNSTMTKIDGEAHAVAYWELANSTKQGPVNYTFVKGSGYKKFDVDRAQRPVASVPSLLERAEAAHARYAK